MIISRSIHVAADGLISFFFVTEWYSIVSLYIAFFVHLPVNRHLARFHVLAIVNSAAINIGGRYLFEL